MKLFFLLTIISIAHLSKAQSKNEPLENIKNELEGHVYQNLGYEFDYKKCNCELSVTLDGYRSYTLSFNLKKLKNVSASGDKLYFVSEDGKKAVREDNRLETDKPRVSEGYILIMEPDIMKILESEFNTSIKLCKKE